MLETSTDGGADRRYGERVGVGGRDPGRSGVLGRVYWGTGGREIVSRDSPNQGDPDGLRLVGFLGIFAIPRAWK